MAHSSTPAGSSDTSVDEIDLAWDDDSSSPPSRRQPASSSPATSAAPTRASALVRPSTSSDGVRAAMPTTGAARQQPARTARERSITPREVPSAKLSIHSPPQSPTVRALPSFAATSTGRTTPAVRPVSVPPRPTSSSPSSEVTIDVAEDVHAPTTAEPALPQTAPKPTAAAPAVAAPAIVHAAEVDAPTAAAPAAVVTGSGLEAAPCLPSIATAWPEAGQDTLRPSYVEPPPALPGRAFRLQTPQRALLVAAIVASLAGVIWLVVGAAGSEPATLAARPSAAPAVMRVPPPAASPLAAVSPPSTAAAAAQPVTTGEPADLLAAVKSGLSDSEDAVPVTVHVSPHNAVVFNQGQRFGTGTVTLNVVRGTKTTLVARLDGYVARTVVVDGTYSSVSIALKRPKSAARPAQDAIPARDAEPSESDSNESRAVNGTPSEGTSASRSEPNKPSPPVSTGSQNSDPIVDVEPL
jgi:hypothetical protein